MARTILLFLTRPNGYQPSSAIQSGGKMARYPRPRRLRPLHSPIPHRPECSIANSTRSRYTGVLLTPKNRKLNFVITPQMSAPDLLRFGYWPSRQLSGEIPSPVRGPDEYRGTEVLNVACTQTGLPAGQQRRLVDEWIRFLPTVPATTIVFSSKVSQELFDAACAAPHLQALSVKWSSCSSLAALRCAPRLQALYLGSSPAISDLSPLSDLPDLRHLFLENVGEPVDLSSIRGLTELRELGLSAARGQRLRVVTLRHLSTIQSLEMLWLVSLEIERDGLLPLHKLQSLKSLRTTMRATSADFKDLCAAVPSLQYFQPVG